MAHGQRLQSVSVICQQGTKSVTNVMLLVQIQLQLQFAGWSLVCE